MLTAPFRNKGKVAARLFILPLFFEIDSAKPEQLHPNLPLPAHHPQQRKQGLSLHESAVRKHSPNRSGWLAFGEPARIGNLRTLELWSLLLKQGS